MIGAVDVLAVMDEAARSQRLSVDRADMREARAAVAELIESVAEVHGADGNERWESCPPDCKSCRIQLALARCRGEA